MFNINAVNSGDLLLERIHLHLRLDTDTERRLDQSGRGNTLQLGNPFTMVAGQLNGNVVRSPGRSMPAEEPCLSALGRALNAQNFTQTGSAVLAVQASGNNASGLVVVQNQATLAGQLAIVPVDGYNPQANDTETVLTGAFAGQSSETAPGWTVSYPNGNSMQVTKNP